MPLAPGSNRSIVSSNISELMGTGKYPQKQAVAIALSNARRHPQADGGGTDPDDAIAAATRLARTKLQFGGSAPWFERAEARQIDNPSSYGFSMGSGGGRTDKNNLDVAAGSYVLPADVVSGLGEGNSLAGASVWDKIIRSLPFGIKPAAGHRGGGPPHPPAPFHDPGGVREPPIAPGIARGGTSPAGKEPDGKVPIAAADGEILVPPHHVQAIGATYFPPGKTRTPKALMAHGHAVLDAMVKEIRGRTITKLESLPGPKGSKNPRQGHTNGGNTKAA